MSKNQTAMVLGINENWVFAASTLLMGLKENLLKVHPDIIIIQDGVKMKDQDLLNSIISCKFIEFNHPVPEKIRQSRGTHMKFSRLLCFDLLNEYEKIIWLDTDMLILKPLDRLFNYGNTGLAMMPHKRTLNQIYKKKCDKWRLYPEFNKYNFDVLVNNSGLMVFSDSLINPKILKDWCLEKMVAWSKNNTSIQPIITLMIQEFNIKVEEVPREYNCPLKEKSKKTIILHAWGEKKFWTDFDIAQWNRYYALWLKSGGKGPISIDNFRQKQQKLLIDNLFQNRIFRFLKRLFRKLLKL